MRFLTNFYILCILISLFFVVACSNRHLTENNRVESDSFCIKTSLCELDDTIENDIYRSYIKIKVTKNKHNRLFFDTINYSKRASSIKDEIIEGYNIYSKTTYLILKIDSFSCTLTTLTYFSPNKNFHIIEHKNSVGTAGNIGGEGGIFHTINIVLEESGNFLINDLGKEYSLDGLKLKENSAMMPHFLDNVIDKSQYRVKYDYYLE